MITSMPSFEDALSTATAEGKVLVVKYYAPWCMACRSVKLKYKTAADKRTAFADFYEVDFAAARVFCALCGISGMPAAHIYGE